MSWSYGAGQERYCMPGAPQQSCITRQPQQTGCGACIHSCALKSLYEVPSASEGSVLLACYLVETGSTRYEMCVVLHLKQQALIQECSQSGLPRNWNTQQFQDYRPLSDHEACPCQRAESKHWMLCPTSFSSENLSQIALHRWSWAWISTCTRALSSVENKPQPIAQPSKFQHAHISCACYGPPLSKFTSMSNSSLCIMTQTFWSHKAIQTKFWIKAVHKPSLWLVSYPSGFCAGNDAPIPWTCLLCHISHTFFPQYLCRFTSPLTSHACFPGRVNHKVEVKLYGHSMYSTKSHVLETTNNHVGPFQSHCNTHLTSRHFKQA